MTCYLSTIEMVLVLHDANREADFYKRIIENSLNEIYIFHPKTLGIMMVNHGACENLGYTMQGLKNMTIFYLLQIL